jgi:hypothetical protein
MHYIFSTVELLYHLLLHYGVYPTSLSHCPFYSLPTAPEISLPTTMTTINSTPAAGISDSSQINEGFSYGVRQEFLTYLESNTASTKTSFSTMKVSEYKNWLIFPNETPNAPKGISKLSL